MFESQSGNNRTGWADPGYDQLIDQANCQVDLQRRAELFREAEHILVAEQTPIVPLYFYAGVTYFDPNKVQGIYQNLLDEHPMQFIHKLKSPSASGTANLLPDRPLAEAKRSTPDPPLATRNTEHARWSTGQSRSAPGH